MADGAEHEVSSTSLLAGEEVHHYQPEPEPDRFDKDLFTVDDIVDLIGGAQDALNRHMAEDSAPHGSPETPLADPVTILDPEPVPEPEPEPEPELETATPDTTDPVSIPEIPGLPETVAPVAPKAEPESSSISPRAAPEPEPAPESDALPPAEPRTRAAAPAEAAERPAVTDAPAAPASLVDLVYWRDVKTSGVVFGASLLLLLSLMACSIVSVCSYIGLALLSVTICFRIYKGILQAIQKSDEGHPFKQYLDQDVALSQDLVHKYSDVVLSKLNKTISELRRLFLVEDLVDSIKFALLMWILTYVGALFNGLTVLILGLIGAFSCPIIYEKHQAQIDHYLALVDNQIKDIVGKIQAKVPGMKRKTE
ncbi:reticulon-1-A-like isoform X6 [Antennarius striatus]|uniref:reticulon-1-A-like isoform X6 n=1 Tax=Antennarius striatus TaxID=241820 RepID=UPI0035B11368